MPEDKFRDELIKELALKLCLFEEPSWMDLDGWEREMWLKRAGIIFDEFILADRRRVLEEVESKLSYVRVGDWYYSKTYDDQLDGLKEAIDEAFQIIARLKGSHD